MKKKRLKFDNGPLFSQFYYFFFISTIRFHMGDQEMNWEAAHTQPLQSAVSLIPILCSRWDEKMRGAYRARTASGQVKAEPSRQ